MDASQYLREITNEQAYVHDYGRVYYPIAKHNAGLDLEKPSRMAQREVVIDGTRFMVQVTVLQFSHET